MTYTIIASTGTNQPNVVLATVITSYALSSILTGIVFALLGAFRTASLVNFFPRHILIVSLPRCCTSQSPGVRFTVE